MHQRVIAYHLIITTYGFWLTNDPRGSWSDFVRSWELARFGEATCTNIKRSVAAVSHDRKQRMAAEAALARDPVEFSGIQCQAIGMGFARYCARSNCMIPAYAILPNHTHLVVLRMNHSIEQTSNLLKCAATAELSKRGLHPFADQPYSNRKLPSPWARHEWSCFLDSDEDIRRSIAYTESNLLKEGKPVQRWPFVTPFLA